MKALKKCSCGRAARISVNLLVATSNESPRLKVSSTAIRICEECIAVKASPRVDRELKRAYRLVKFRKIEVPA
jgi:hypothetical protein